MSVFQRRDTVHLARDRFRPFMSFRVRFAGNLVGRCNVLLRVLTHRHANKFNRRIKQNSVEVNVFHDCLTIVNENEVIRIALNYLKKFFSKQIDKRFTFNLFK